MTDPPAFPTCNGYPAMPRSTSAAHLIVKCKYDGALDSIFTGTSDLRERQADTHAHTHAHTHTHTHMHTHTCTHTHAHTHMHTHIHINTYAQTHAHTCMDKHIHVRTKTRAYNEKSEWNTNCSMTHLTGMLAHFACIPSLCYPALFSHCFWRGGHYLSSWCLTTLPSD